MKKVFFIAVLLGLSFFMFASTKNETFINAAFITGSPLMLSGGTVSRLDPDNFGLAVKITANRALVPAGAFDGFGAKVQIDADKKTARILYNGKTAVFTAGKKSFRLNGREYPLDASPEAVSGTLFIPLRAVSEKLFIKPVSYCSGVIEVGNKRTDAAYLREVKEKIGQATRPQSISDLKAIISGIEINAYDTTFIKAKNSAQFSAVSGEGYSRTNIQVDGIDEADTVKTDGKYIYIAANRTIYIVSASNPKTKIVSKITLEDDLNVREIYADGNRLAVIGQKFSDGGEYHIMNGANAKALIYPYYNKNTVFVSVYNIESPEKPIKIREFEVEGTLFESRRNGDTLYITANRYIYEADGGTDDIMPKYRDGENAALKPVGISHIICPPNPQCAAYATVAALSLSDPEKPAGVESILGAAGRLYMSASSLYLTRTEFEGNEQKTVITKIALNGTDIGYSASCFIPGGMESQFWMDEKDGYLRAAASDSVNGSNLYILDERLNTAGKISGIAKGEKIYSVRFVGDRGYIVTFRSVDPLFAIDLSDPKNPQIKGELKIPGFSNYLHPVGENLLLGIGQDAKDMYVKDKNGRDVVVGTYTGGIKLSLFDVSDMGKPVEKDTMVLGDTGSYTDALYNHKALMAGPENGIVGFEASVSGGLKDSAAFDGAVLIKIKNGCLKETGRIPASREENYGGGDEPFTRRLLYIGDTLYYLRDGMLRAFDYNTLKEKSRLVLS